MRNVYKTIQGCNVRMAKNCLDNRDHLNGLAPWESTDEVVDTIQTAPWQEAELSRLECRKDYPFDSIWNKKHYQTKQVRPIFVEEEREIVVVTVYTYYY